MWEDRRLRDITEADLRQLVTVQLEEHLQLEYKSALYDGNDQGSKESLLDICMFANSGGGIVLIGISEQRDANGQPTGMPDPDADLGIEIPNTEMVLQAYDARVIANIQERLPLELYAIPVANNRHVIAIRVLNSMSKPHRVHYQGRTYFPSRRERQRYEMDVREIKEMVMRTASRLEEAEDKLSTALLAVAPQVHQTWSLVVGCIPVFWQNFMIDVRSAEVIQTVSNFNVGHRYFSNVTYNFNGLQRQLSAAHDDSVVQVHRDGVIVLHRRLPTVREGGVQGIRPTGIDIIVRVFVEQSSAVYRAAAVNGPFLLTMLLQAANIVTGFYPMAGMPQVEEAGATIPAGSYPLPVIQADNFLNVDQIIRPLCDQIHQMFGKESSPCFNEQGVWVR